MKKVYLLICAFCLVISYSTQAQINEIESNDSLHLANELPLNTTISGQVCDWQNTDYFRVILPDDGYLKIRTLTGGEGENPNSPYVYTLFNTNGEAWNSFSPLAGENGAMIADSSGWCCLYADTFFVKVQTDYAFTYCYEYSFSLELIPPTFQNDLEPNSTATGPMTTLDYNTSSEGHVAFLFQPQNGGTDAFDFFRIIPPSNGLVRLFIESEAQMTGSNDIKVMIHNEDGGPWYQQSSPVGAFQSPNSDTLYWECIPNDTMMFQIFIDNYYDRGYSYRIRYDIVQPQFANDVEPNNNQATAQLIDLATSVPGNQYYFSDGSEDVFKFATVDTGFFKVRVTSSTNSTDGNGGTKLQLLDHNFGYISQLNAPLGTTGELAMDSMMIAYLAQDTFYLKVYSDYAYAACRSYLLEFFYSGQIVDGLEEFSLHNVHVFPNPTNGKFTVDTRMISGDGEMSVFNSMGELIISKNIVFGTQKEFDLADCSPGIYFIKTVSGKRSKTHRLIVE
jgi:hypothetical protein